MTVDATPRVLIVEDNRDLALGLRVNLEAAAYQVLVAHDVGQALAAMRRGAPDLVLLDLALPDGDGIDLARRLRLHDEQLLILMLTARSQRDAKLLGLRAGADDYVTKPFDLEELLARIAALLRRRSSRTGAVRTKQPASPVIPHTTIGDAEIDVEARRVRRGGKDVGVSRIGFELLVRLIANRGVVLSRAELMREVWGYDASVASRTLDTHIFELRRLLEPDPGAPRFIKTVWRIGYRLD